MIGPLSEKDLPEIFPIEELSYPTPWSERMFRQEFENPLGINAGYREPNLKGYVFAWIIFEDLHFNNIAVHPDVRKSGIGAKLLGHVIEESKRRGVLRASLEVRPSNAPARALYKSFGFEEIAVRKGYYFDTGEDALILVSKFTTKIS